jgi:hypothetical protein
MPSQSLMQRQRQHLRENEEAGINYIYRTGPSRHIHKACSGSTTFPTRWSPGVNDAIQPCNSDDKGHGRKTTFFIGDVYFPINKRKLLCWLGAQILQLLPWLYLKPIQYFKTQICLV